MIQPILIGIDPGISAGGISVLDNGRLFTFKMPEKFSEIVAILKPFGRGKCSLEQINIRPNFNAFANARMDSLKENFVNVKNALEVNEIEVNLVHPRTWITFHNLALPKGTGEKGLDYSHLTKLKTELKHLQIHLSIESKVPNHEIIVGDIRYILESSGRKEARMALCDNFAHFTKYDLNQSIKQTEKEIEKFKNQEKRIRKNRYKKRASELAGRKVSLWEADSILILLYQKYN